MWQLTLVDDYFRVECVDNLGAVRATLLVRKEQEADAMHLVSTLTLAKVEPLVCGIDEHCQSCGRS